MIIPVLFWIALILCIGAIFVLKLQIIVFKRSTAPPPPITPKPHASTLPLSQEKCTGGCSSSPGENIDPVSEPSYNMKEIAKQSILLEDHLTQANKRCKDCIVKHFLTLQGYAEEGVSLANENLDQYPLLAESVPLYKELLSEWLKEKSDQNKMMSIAERLREHRKKIVAKYYLEQGP